MSNNKNLETSNSSTTPEIIEISERERALSTWVRTDFYQRFKESTYEECLREKWAIEGVLENGFEIEDKKDLKVKVNLLEEIVARKSKELTLKGLPIPKISIKSGEDILRERFSKILNRIPIVKSKI